VLNISVLFLSGEQVKNLLMKSGLPMPVLGHIWYVLCHALHYVFVFVIDMIGNNL